MDNFNSNQSGSVPGVSSSGSVSGGTGGTPNSTPQTSDQNLGPQQIQNVPGAINTNPINNTTIADLSGTGSLGQQSSLNTPINQPLQPLNIPDPVVNNQVQEAQINTFGSVNPQTTQPVDAQQQSGYEVPNYSTEAKPQKSKSKILLIILLVGGILFAIFSALYYFLIFNPIFSNPLSERFGPKEEQPVTEVPQNPDDEVPVVQEDNLENDAFIQDVDNSIKETETAGETPDLNQVETDLENTDYSGIETE
jgi:hypothetical protein